MMGRVTFIQKGTDGFVWSVAIVVSTNASRTFDAQILYWTANKFLLQVDS